MFERLSLYFLPGAVSSTDEKRRSLLLINFMIVLSIFSLTYLLGCYFTDIIVGVYTNLIMFPLCLAALFIFKYTKRFVLSVSMMIIGFTAGIAEGVLFSGNIASPAIPWLITAPSLAFLLGNKKSGILWTIVIAFLFSLFGLFSITKLDLPYLFPAYLQNYILTFTFIAVTVFLSIVLAIYDRTRENASNALLAEKEKSETLLLNILPSEVAEELKENGYAAARQFDEVTVLFTDFVNFTQTAENLAPQQLVQELHECFTAFDHIIERNGLEKIKTIGDAYLAVCGLPATDPQHGQKTIQAALEIRDFMAARAPLSFGAGLGVRLGIHSGSVVAGIVGVKKFAYDIWGDTVNTAARMEQSGGPGKVNISETTYELVKDKFECTYRGKIQAKNKGELDMYFVEK